MINEETRAFIAAHASDDVRRLALNAKVAEGVDLRAALVQIEGAQRLKYKAPRFAATAWNFRSVYRSSSVRARPRQPTRQI